MLSAISKTGLVFFPAFDWAISSTHPEREERLLYTQDQVFEEGLLDIDGIVEYKPDLATIQDVRRVHFCVPDEWSVLTESHLISAGGAKTIGTEVMEKRIERGFALVRPPGHHAMRVVHGARGFCNINIEAIMIEYLREAYGIDRVAIVDTDCHHGDGTQDIYWHDPDTLFISLHQDGRTLYPGTGFCYEMGGATAAGTTINIPLPPQTSEEGFLYTLDNAILPILEEFKPEIIVNSAGQDNHYTDPITNMNFSAQGYAELTRRLKPDIAVLEGGYSIETALPYINVGIIMALAGMDFSKVKEPDYHPDRIRQSRGITRQIEEVVAEVMDCWQKGPEIREKYLAGKPFVSRGRSIFYDTDNILETQRENLRVCPDCSGVLAIDSETDTGYHIYAVHIPRKACKECQEMGYKWYDSADQKIYHQIFLQDRTHDQYFVKKV
ncbi:histone deacetylase family protein [Desulforhabdus amnigena]|jgi:acetoin utilization deacetylase AcuC-like enzyme|uniref:Histone deacetylase n=1 Tax=Desulforhabdus amnigena TaxID=40218 RepID=A0A9W6D1Y7_9BACT|nr:histone deacetylase [Desulforhabdus amnigena]NLJ29352.1 histone deacetylase [Deltaproteobacteria bacterium]GLI34380.1 histone deacetylase [Desulforhabdus amnigena]